MSALKKEVLKCFKSLHKTRKYIFEGDIRALDYVRSQINGEFKKNKDVQDGSKIKELIKLASAVEHEIKTTIIQAKEVKPNVYQARIKPETVKLDNVIYNPELVALHEVDSKPKKCCKEEK